MKSSNSIRICLVAALATGLAACEEGSAGRHDAAGAAGLQLDNVTCGLRAENGRNLNGASLNGLKINGASLNGLKTNGASLNGASLNGKSFNGRDVNGLSLGLEGSALVVRQHGEPLSGDAIVGGIIDAGRTDDGQPFELRVEALEVRAPDHHAYTLSWRAGDGEWTPVCTDLEGNPDPGRKVTILKGTWNEAGDKIDTDELVTLACDGFALGKCVGLGYAPWRTHEVCRDGVCEEISLAAHHQACTRMIRADYCGDGNAHTVDGTLVNLYDGVGIQADEGGEGWQLEAEWTTEGAACIRSPRIAALDGECTTPCLDALRARPLPECGSPEHLALRGDPSADDQVLLVTEHPAHGGAR